MSKRLLVVRGLQHTGLLRLLETLPSPPGIVVLNYHRIGDALSTCFDRGSFSQTQAGLEEQIHLIRKRMPIVGVEELEELVTGKAPLNRTHAVLTFDDGYLDSYTRAFPVLQSLGVPGIFFPVTDFIGTAHVPWWDEIAYLVRHTAATSVRVSMPEPLHLHLGDDREPVIRQLLHQYKKPSNRDGDAFLRELRESTACMVPQVKRRFISWDEARTMSAAGMDFGSHTCSHTLLSQQSSDRQRWELEQSKRILETELNGCIHALAYPVGSRNAFTEQAEALALKAGYTMAFAFHGGWNPARSLRPLHLQRLSPATHTSLLRMQIGALLHLH